MSVAVDAVVVATSTVAVVFDTVVAAEEAVVDVGLC